MNVSTVAGEWFACAALLRHAVQAHANRGSNWLSWSLAGGIVLSSSAGFAVGEQSFKVLMGIAGIFTGLLALLWWVLLISSLALQVFGSGRLVPGIGRRSATVLALVWLAMIPAVSVPIVLAGAPVLATALYISLGLVFVALCVTLPPLGWLVFAAVFGPYLIEAWAMPLSDDAVLVSRILLTVWAAILVRRAFGRDESAGIMDGGAFKLGGTPQTGAAASEYARALRRDCADGKAAALMLHCLRPIARSSLMVPAGIVGIACALALAVPSLSTLYRANPITQLTMLGVAIFMQLVLVHTMGASVRQSAGEQALVLLAAHRPEAGAINALLARSLTLQYGKAWLGTTLVVLAISAAFGAPMGELVWMLALFLIPLAAGTRLLSNYAVPEKGSSGMAALMAIGAVAMLIAAFGSSFTVPVGAAFAGGWMAWALLLFTLRYRAMLRAPVAFPAGRR